MSRQSARFRRDLEKTYPINEAGFLDPRTTRFAGYRRDKDMGYLEQRRRRVHAQSANWEAMTALMLFADELERAKQAGLDHDEKGNRAIEIRDVVLKDIGGKDRFTRALIDADFELRSSNRNADLQDSLERAMDISGYTAARDRLFPA